MPKGKGLSQHSMRFADYVTGEQVKKLQPYIQGQVQQLGQHLARTQLAAMADQLTRLSVLEDLVASKRDVLLGLSLVFIGLGFMTPAYASLFGALVAGIGTAFVFARISKNRLAELVTAKEDESTGYKSVKGPAKVGDMLRVTIQGKGEADKTFGNPTPMRIRRLMTEPYTLNQEVESALIGAKAGQTKIIPYSVTNKVKNSETEELEDKTFTYTFKVKIDRISVLKNPPKAAPKVAEETQEAANA